MAQNLFISSQGAKAEKSSKWRSSDVDSVIRTLYLIPLIFISLFFPTISACHFVLSCIHFERETPSLHVIFLEQTSLNFVFLQIHLSLDLFCLFLLSVKWARAKRELTKVSERGNKGIRSQLGRTWVCFCRASWEERPGEAWDRAGPCLIYPGWHPGPHGYTCWVASLLMVLLLVSESTYSGIMSG